ncbi:hypothetical protein B0O80DRAFT_446750 [Mortierella sp. GBAus27b]|nr:hypothetical protein BGX31_000722 [Mortierella sp. GBA43]KAI8357194.1 hypothetical protein B0O80DRAFT_446750 [Mortierella sp. GBAus27b]
MARSDPEKDLIQTSATAGVTDSAASASSPAPKPDPDTPTDTTTTVAAPDSEKSSAKEDSSTNTALRSPITPADAVDQQDTTDVPKNDAEEPRNQSADDAAVDPTAAAAAAAAQAIARALDTTADDIKALTKALTTPIETEEQTASTVAAASTSAARPREEQEPTQPEASVPAPAFDVNNVYNQVLSMATQNQKNANGKRAAQDDFEQNQAARALQLIALSLNGTTNQTPDDSGLEEGADKLETHSPASNSSTFAQALKGHSGAPSSAPDASDSLIAISHAINFPSQNTVSTKLEVDTNTFAQAILNATQADANRSSSSAPLGGDANPGSSTDAGNGSTSTANVTTGNASSSTQEFTFEVDKATGKAQIKWTTDPKDVVSVLPDTTAIQQALQTLIAQSGIDLGVSNGGLLAPPLGQFPAQGSEFGSAQDPVASEAATAPITPARKKRKTGGSSTQNTAASIPEGAPSFPCNFDGCDKVFARLYNLKSHSRTHTNERPFVCSHCQLAFSRNHDLKRHVKIHAGDKPFKCNGCGKSFSRLDALGRHRGNAKNRTGCSTSEST